MEDVRTIMLKWFLSLVSMLLTIGVASALSGDGFDELLMPADEKEQRRDARLEMERLAKLVPKLQGLQLNSHEQVLAAGIVAPDNTRGLACIGGHTQLKDELMMHVVVPLQNADVFFRKASLRPPTGVLLSGPSGTGKTMIAMALAAETKLPFLSVRASTIEQKYHGESEKMVRALFSLARKLSPCIVFIDEIDGLLGARSDFDASVTHSVITQFLQEMDALDTDPSHPVVIVAATNRPKKLDPAVYRRIPRTYTVGLPDANARKHILLENMKDEPVKTLPKDIIHDTEGFSGADMKELYKAAAAVRNEGLARSIVRGGKAGVYTSILPPLRGAHWASALTRMYNARKLRGM